MSFEEILEMIRDFNGEISINELLNSGVDLDDFENLGYEEICKRLEQKFERD